MYRFLLIFITALLIPTVSLNAQWRSLDDAAQIALQSRSVSSKQNRAQSKNQEVTLSYSLCDSKSGNTLIYGFNYGDEGFAIVSGLEQTVSVLGYSDSGQLPSNVKDMPDGLAYMLEVYKEQIQYAAQRSNKQPAKVAAKWHPELEPLIKTQWEQSSPFNNYCPANCPAGCVAIAMAQVMNYHQWPDTGVGSRNGYDFNSRNWDWNKMPLQYPENTYTVESANEVASLVRYLGASVNMEYDISGSGATTYEMVKSLHDYWKYDDGMSYANRDNYSDRMWESLIYEEIQQHRPVLYEGHGKKLESKKAFDSQSSIPGSELGLGHVFILDGYKKGLFHVNWGWGGYLDGYFMINNLNPTGNKFYEEYLYNQSVFLGVQPETSDSVASRLESREKWTLSGASVMDDRTLELTGFLSCYSIRSFSGKVGAIVTDLETQEQYTYLEETINNLEFDYGKSVTVHVPTKELKSNHSYKAELVYQSSESSEITVLPVPIDQPTLTFRVGNAEGAKELYPRRMVVEEGTGTWCPWCVRGIVGMEYMAKNYPDNYIGIAIHSGDADPMNYEDAYGLSFSNIGFPSAYFNRNDQSNPSSLIMENYLKNQSGFTTDAMVKITSVTYSDDYSQLKVSANTRFGFDKLGADYRLAYVITEDSVGPYMQSNGYASTNSEMGGFENLPSLTSVVFNDVARGIYPSLTGVEGSVPATINACTDYSYEYSFPMPKNCDDYENLNLTILLYDTKTGEIVNADRVACPIGKPTIDLSIDMGNEPGTLAEKLGNQIYDITSLTISGKINGLDLGTLRSMMGCDSENQRLVYLDLKNASIVKGGVYMNGKTLDEDNALPEEVFSKTKSLTTLITPLSLRVIHNYALSRAVAIQEVILNEGLEVIGASAFWSFEGNLLKRLNIPSTVKSLGDRFIEGCQLLTEFSINENNPYFVFDGKAVYTKGYERLITIVPSYIGDYTVNEKCSSIGADALYNNYFLTGLVASNVMRIESGAFCFADGLKYLAIGSSLKYIGSSAFWYCDRLDTIYLGCTDVPTGEYINSYWDNIGRCTLYVPQASIDKFKSNSFWSQMKDIKPIEDTEYAYLANLGDGSVKKNIITNMVGTLSSLLGDEIYDITHLTISGPINGADLGTLRSMMGCGDSYNTTGIHQQLEYLDLSNANVVEGGEYTDGKFLMENDILPEYVFYKNQSLQYLNVPKSLKKICRYALGYSEVLEEVVLNEGLESVETYSIYHSPVKRLNIPSTLKSWGFGFLSYCNSLEDLSLSIDNPYYVCDGQAVYSKGYETLIRILPTVSTYEVNSNCKEITSVAFMGTYNLESIVAPYVKNVGQSAFWSNYVVTIGFGASLSSLGETIFNYCNNLSEIYLGCENIPMGGYRNSDWEQIINCTLYVPKSSINAFKADSFWGKMKEIKAIEGTEYEYLKDIVISDIDKVYSEDKNVDRIYTLDGRLVNKMSKGMYIVNGKKVIVK